MSTAQDALRAATEVQAARQRLAQAKADLARCRERLAQETAAVEEKEREIRRERAAWDRAIAGFKRKGWKAVGWTPKETCVALGVPPEMVGRYVYGAVWSRRMESMPGYVYSCKRGQLSYPVCYFRRRDMKKQVSEERTCLLAVNFRRMLRHEPPVSFEEARKLDKNIGQKWRLE